MGELLGMDLEQELSRAEVDSVSDYASVSPSVGASNSNVQVVVRVRPPSSREKDQGYCKCLGVDVPAHSVSLNLRPQPRTFTFDYVADEGVNQEEFFQSVGKPITDACLQGYHCCLIAYGQTGAGKTFTMEGPDSDLEALNLKVFGEQSNFTLHEKHGLIPRILHYIFESIMAEKMQGVSDVEYVMKCSYLQIYNEQVSDLLDPGSTNLTIHENAKRGMYVEGLQEVVVSTAAATYAVFRRGSENRHVGMTAMNMESSRSHSVFTLVVESQRRNDGGVMNRRTSRFYLVDLAGSERQKHSESAGIRLKEAGSINKSLSALGNVIKALVDISEGKIRHVPYRDSKLTFLLKDALGGNSKCTLVANVSPAEKNVDETLSTLKFAQRAKLMLNTAVVNEDMFGNPAIMGEEIRRLRLEIAFLRASIGTAVSADQISLPPQEVQSESIRVNRLEHIISQSTKRSLASERKAASEIKELAMRLEATQAICERLDKTLQSHKMIIRLRENRLKRLENGTLSETDEILDLREEIDHLRKQIEHHPDVVRFKMELDLCRAQLDDYRDGRKDEESLQSQIDQIENLNHAIKIEFQEVLEDKASLNTELSEVENDRDALKAQLQTMEEQFLKLRDAVEKYRQEAEDAIYRQSRAEEKLQDSTTEQNEVWRRCNLAEAQATELAQELALQKSQGDKMDAAFREQSKLQEDMFLELQNATLERDEAKKVLGDVERRLADTAIQKSELENRLQELESQRTKAASSLEEMVVSSEQLSAAIKEKDAGLLDMKSQIERLEVSLRAAQDMLTSVIAGKEAAESEKLLAVERSCELAQQLENALAEKLKAEGLVADTQVRQEQVLREAEDLVAGVTKLLLEKEEASINRTDDLLRQVDIRQLAVEEKVEEIRSCFEREATRLEEDLGNFSQELGKQLHLASCVESVEAQCKKLEERNTALHGENVGLQQIIQSLERKEQEQKDRANDLQRQLNEALAHQQTTAEQLFAITADYENVMQSFSEKHVLDIAVDRGATPVQEEPMGVTSSLANLATSNASKGTDVKFVADKAESTPLKCQVHVQDEPDSRSFASVRPVEHVSALEVKGLSILMNDYKDAEPSVQNPVGAAQYLEGDTRNPNALGSAGSKNCGAHHAHTSSPVATCIIPEVGDEPIAVQLRDNRIDQMAWTLSVQGIAPKLSVREFAIDSQNVGPGQTSGKFAEVRGACATPKRSDDQQRELVLLDMNRPAEDFNLEAIKKDSRTIIYSKEAPLEDAGLKMGPSIIDNCSTLGRSVDSGHRESRNEGLKYLMDLVKSAIQEIECQLRKHSEIFKPSALCSEADQNVLEASIVVSSASLARPCEDFQKNLAKYKDTMRLWEYSRQKWEEDLVFMKNEMTQIEGFRTAYDDLIPRLQELVSAGEDLMSASQQDTCSWQQTNWSCDNTTTSLQMNGAALHNAVEENSCDAGVRDTTMPNLLKEHVVPSHLQKGSFRHLKATGKKVSSKFLKDSTTPSLATQGPPVGACLPRPSAADTDRLKHVRIPTTAPPQTKLTVSSTAARMASCVGSSLAVRRPLQPIHGNTAPNRSAGPRKRHQIQPKGQAQVEPLPSLPSPKSSYKRRRLG